MSVPKISSSAENRCRADLEGDHRSTETPKPASTSTGVSVLFQSADNCIHTLSLVNRNNNSASPRQVRFARDDLQGRWVVGNLLLRVKAERKDVRTFGHAGKPLFRC